MGIFICEKCGKLDNTACNNNYYIALINRHRKSEGEKCISFKDGFEYFETHFCCSDCCDGLAFKDGSGTMKKSDRDIKDKVHWTKYGKETLFEWEKRNDGSMVNATEYFKSIGEI